jgi:sugar lactone lactonase YvrE
MTSQCVYVTNTKPQRVSSITAYPITASGNVAPAIDIAGAATGLVDATGVAVDAQHNIYVSNIVAGSQTNSDVLVFAAGATGDLAPLQTISGPNTELEFAWGIAVDAAGNIYVANQALSGAPSSVNVYAPGANGDVAPIRRIAGNNPGLTDPTAVALDPSGNLYVANKYGSTVKVFAPGANGNARPIQTITGGKTRINLPTGIALDAAGNIYVSEYRVSEMTVFPPGATGNVAPLWRIYGTASLLRKPHGIGLDAANRLYIANSKTESVLIYAPGAQGKTAPVQRIFGGKTKIHGIEGLAIR